MSETTHNGADKPMDPQPPVVAQAVTPGQAEAYRKAILAVMPGLTGAIDQALREQMGEPVAFVIFTFGKGGSAFSSNITDSKAMQAAVTGIVVSWSETGLTDDDALTLHKQEG